MSSQSPHELAVLLSDHGSSSIYESALKNWFDKSTDKLLKDWQGSCTKCSLSDLKNLRPDILPLRFIVIAEGVSGLVAREYVQGAEYVGDYSKVLFFDTPHEGTGYADQALFQNSEGYSLKKPDVSSLAAVVPLAMAAYLLDGVGGLSDAAVSIAKNAVLGMVGNIDDVSDAISKADFFNEYSASSNALWYLTQDASFDDKKYASLISASSADVVENIGGTQWLNSTGMNTKFSHPSYSIVYSYGFPTVGNGRRTYDDFSEQVKGHISKEKLKRVITDSLAKSISNAGVDVSTLKGDIENMAAGLLDGKITDETKKLASGLVSSYSNLSSVLNDEKFAGYIHALSDLKSLKLNVDDLSGSAMKILRILEKFIPDEYKSELFSAFMDNFSPEVADALKDAAKCAISGGSVRGCVASGISVSATSLSNYGLNFFDEGVFDVPLYSAFASNVEAFKNASVFRKGYDLSDFVKDNSSLYGDLYSYSELLADVGKLEQARKIVDEDLKPACVALVAPFDEVCKAAAFAANIVLIGDISGKTSKLVGKMKALKDTKYLSLSASVKKETEVDYTALKSSKTTKFNYPDIENMLFETPKISMASILKKGDASGALDSIVPLMIYGNCNGDVYDEASLEKNCVVISDEKSDDASSKESSNTLYETSFAEKDGLVSSQNADLLTVKDVRYVSSTNSVVKTPNYWKWKAATVRHFIYEYRFVIDDFQPDSLRLIRFDFNSGVQIAYERSASAWKVQMRTGGDDWSDSKDVASPIRSDGLLVFRPKDVLDMKLDGKEHVLVSLQKEGPNMVQVYVVNKMGLSESAEFTYFFESTPPLMEAGWPVSSALLSRADNPYITYNKQDEVPRFSDMKVSVYKFDKQPEVGSATAKSELIDAGRGTYKISADLKSVWDDASLPSGNYYLEWVVGILDDQGKRNESKLRTMVYIDRDKPTLDVTFKDPEVVSGLDMMVNWGTIENKDPESNRAIRALRVLVEKDGSVTPVKYVAKTTEHYLDFGWEHGVPSSEGWAKIVVQAFDYANSNETMGEELATLLGNDGSAVWDKVAKRNGDGTYGFVNGINGATIEKNILIDNTKPSIVDGSFAIEALHQAVVVDRPVFGGAISKVSLGIGDTLRMLFDINEPLLGRASETVAVRIHFDDDAHDVHKLYARDTVVTATENGFEFVEPEADRLKNGVYDISVELIDQAGNVNTIDVYDGFVVDRIAPVIRDMKHGDVAFANVSELVNSTIYVNQSADYEYNRSELSCYAKISSGGKSSNWFSVGTEKLSKNGGDSNPYDFDISGHVTGLPNGLWSVRVGCFDAVGNYGENVGFFGMGVRYPQITFPEEGSGDYFSGKILIEGKTPNPIVKDGNDAAAKFRIEWCNEATGECGDKGITLLTESISDQVKTLAMWDTEGFDQDSSYTIRLTVEGCDNQGVNCESASAERTVFLNDGAGDGTSSTELPKLMVEEYPDKVPAATDGVVSLELDGIDTSKWTLNVDINVQSQNDPSKFVLAESKYFSTVTASPFKGEPSTKKEGLSVWQTGKVWNVYWKGSAESSIEGVAPHISLRYQKAHIDFSKTTAKLPNEDASVVMPAVNTGTFDIPAYDATRDWEIDGSEILIQFETDSAFIVDVSSVKDIVYTEDKSGQQGRKQKIYCGENSSMAGDVVTASKGVPVLYVNPQQYKASFVWSGLISPGGMYPGGKNVKLSAYAYRKSDKTKIIFCEKSWEQAEVDNFEIVTDGKAVKEFYVGLTGDASSEGKSFAKSNFVFDFGIKGEPAKVTAEIIDPQGNVKKTLMSGIEPLLAGTSNSAYSVSWDGMSDDNYATSAEGTYKLVLTARREGKEDVTLTHEFNLIWTNKLIAAPTTSTNEGEYPAVLEIDEAQLDEQGNLRYYGYPDYLLEADVTANVLPEDQKNIEYKWKMNGTQHPIYFEKNRFSLGIHRHRDEFKVTVAVLLVGYGFDLNDVYKQEERRNNIKLYWTNVTLKENELKDISKIELDPSSEIVGMDKDHDKHSYPLKIGAAVRIYPASMKKIIADYFSIPDKDENSMRGYVGDKAMNGSDIETWESIWDGENKWNDISSLLDGWSQNFNALAPYWEAKNVNFTYNKGKFDLENKTPSFACKVSNTFEDNNENGTFVCNGAEESNYDVHRDMMKITVSPTDGNEDFSYGNYDCWFCDNKNADTEIGIKLTLDVKKDYWWPQWGYSNLANTFTRFDPENIALYDGQGGYCGLNAGPCRLYNGKSVDGSVWLKDSKSDGITAFEAKSLSLNVQQSDNPLLFADEYNDGDIPSPSTFSMKFYNAVTSPTPFIADAVVNGNNSNNLLYSDDATKDSLVIGPIDNPLKLTFYVAPNMTKAQAVKSVPSVSVQYPFDANKANFDQVESDIASLYPNSVFYRGMASGLHFSVGDWTRSDWNGRFLTGISPMAGKKLTEKVVKNPLTFWANPNDGTIISELNDYTPLKDALGATYPHKVDGNAPATLDYWKVPVSKFDVTKPAKDEAVLDGEGILVAGDPELSVITPGWTLNEAGDALVNEGESQKAKLSFVLSKNKDQTFSEHLTLKEVKSQNLEFFKNPLMKKIEIGNPVMYARGKAGEIEDENGKRMLHPYFKAEYVDKEKEFVITRTRPLDYAAREPEVLTLRGRVPGENRKWNLMYVQNGEQHLLKSDVQVKVPVDEPYPVLDYAEMNRLQGNVSIFLTYGGENGDVYVLQKDLHVGHLIKGAEGGQVYSMYDEISVNFMPGAWGSRNVDVTVRTIPKEDEYNFNNFENLDVVGPVVEILPSHDFSDLDNSLWPLINVRLQCSAIKDDPKELRVYKPNFETMELEALETQSIMAFDAENNEIEMDDPDFDDKCNEVEIVAKTKTFSTFVVMDENAAKKVKPVDPGTTEPVELACHERALDTLWAGTANGWLEYEYPCQGKSNYLWQLRKGSDVAAEHQEASADPIVWKVRGSDFYRKDDFYSSMITFYGSDGVTEQVLGPVVRIDSVVPVFVGDADVSVSDEGLDQVLQVDVSISDVGSGVAKTRFDLYFGGFLLQSSTVMADSVISKALQIRRKDLYNCVGCKASIVVTTEDYGHNYSKITLQSEPLYPYPSSLVLWYPLGEGAGNVAYEAKGTGLNLDLSKMKNVWFNGVNATFRQGQSATSENCLLMGEASSSFSIEIKASVGRNLGSIASWDGSESWTIGVDENRQYYIESPLAHETFMTKAEFLAMNHLVWTIEGNQVTLYKNGIFMERKALPFHLEWAGSGKPVLGKFTENGSLDGFAGNVSDFRIYRDVLTAEQVFGLYKGLLDLEDENIYVARAVDLTRDGLVIDQSCGIAGKAYLHQSNPISSLGTMTWSVNAIVGDYALYLKMMNYASEPSHVEVYVNGVSQGVYRMNSTGLWESQRVGSLVVGLAGGINTVTIRPVGNIGVAGIALASASLDLAADEVDYAEGSWTTPEPRVIVKMNYNSPDDRTWVRTQFKLKNLTGETFNNVRIRYYYKGEGENVGSMVFNPWNEVMSVYPDAGSVYYGEFVLNQPIAAYGSAYDGSGPFFGLYRTPKYEPWDISDDPSYAEGARYGFVDADGVALLDEEGNLLNDWQCYDIDGPADVSAKSVRAWASDEKYGSKEASTIKLVVENTGSSLVKGFEARYYFRDDYGDMQMSLYEHNGANVSVVSAGGNLYYVSAKYSNTILNPGEKVDYGNGFKFELHYPNHQSRFDAFDDPSYHGIFGREEVVADSVVVLDLNGNLLWGHAPRPSFSSDYTVSDNNGKYIYRDGNMIYVDVDVKDYYYLQVVNAMSLPLATLFSGTWAEGEHAVDISNYNFSAGSYLVLRRNSNILNWQLLK